MEVEIEEYLQIDLGDEGFIHKKSSEIDIDSINSRYAINLSQNDIENCKIVRIEIVKSSSFRKIWSNKTLLKHIIYRIFQFCLYVQDFTSIQPIRNFVKYDDINNLALSILNNMAIVKKEFKFIHNLIKFDNVYETKQKIEKTYSELIMLWGPVSQISNISSNQNQIKQMKRHQYRKSRQRYKNRDIQLKDIKLSYVIQIINIWFRFLNKSTFKNKYILKSDQKLILKNICNLAKDKQSPATFILQLRDRKQMSKIKLIFIKFLNDQYQVHLINYMNSNFDREGYRQCRDLLCLYLSQKPKERQRGIRIQVQDYKQTQNNDSNGINIGFNQKSQVPQKGLNQIAEKDERIQQEKQNKISNAINFNHKVEKYSDKVCMQHKRPFQCYCLQCKQLMCPTCHYSIHKRHQFQTIEETAEKIKTKIHKIIQENYINQTKIQNNVQRIRENKIQLQRKFEERKSVATTQLQVLIRKIYRKKDQFLQINQNEYKKKKDFINRLEDSWSKKTKWFNLLKLKQPKQRMLLIKNQEEIINHVEEMGTVIKLEDSDNLDEDNQFYNFIKNLSQ